MAKITGGSVVVIMYDQVMYTPGGVVGKWGINMCEQLKRAIKAEAPHSAEARAGKMARPNKSSGAPPPGNLRAQIHRATSIDPVARSIDMVVSSDADYTTYVIFGTGPIFARSAGGQFRHAVGGMRLPAQPWAKPIWTQRVSGQKPNDFMSRGVNKLAARHSSLRSYKVGGRVSFRP